MTDDKPYNNEETLRELYHDEGMSTIEMAERFGVSDTTIRNYMDRHDVKRQKAYNDPTRPVRHFFDERDGVGDCYEKVQSHHDGQRHTVYIHRLVAYAHGKLDFEGLCNSKVEVHHKSGHGLDNRPDNIEVKNRTIHQSEHNDERYGNGGWRDKELLSELLDEMTQKEIAEELGCSERTIYVWKQKHGLE